jgi:hypothetical protein
MTAYGIFGDVEASPKLVRAALSDLLEAHRRTTPDDDFWITVGVRNADIKVHDEILDWAVHNAVYHEIVTPAATYTPFAPSNKLTVSASFMLDVVEAMRTEGGKILALVGDQTPRVDVLRALAKAKDNGTEVRDLAEAGLTLILFQGDDPPPEDPKENINMAAEEEATEATLAELGEYADDTADEETAEQAQELLNEAAAEAGVDPNDYATWLELALALQEMKDGEEGGEPEEEPEPVIEGLTREALVGKEIAEIKALAKAAGIEGYTKMRREPLINALLGESTEPEPASAAKKKLTRPAAKETPAAAANGDATSLTDDDIERIADAVVTKLAAALSTA